MNTLNDLRYAMEIGRMNHTVYSIWKHLVDGQERYARSEFEREGDKIHGHQAEPIIVNLIGCRLHGIKDCPKPFCKLV